MGCPGVGIRLHVPAAPGHARACAPLYRQTRLGRSQPLLHCPQKPTTFFTDEWRCPVSVHDIVAACLRLIAEADKPRAHRCGPGAWLSELACGTFVESGVTAG